MTIPDQIKDFCNEFVKSWEDKNNAFSDPLNRTISCCTTIEYLAQQDITNAKILYGFCTQMKAFNAKIGHIENLQSVENNSTNL